MTDANKIELLLNRDKPNPEDWKVANIYKKRFPEPWREREFIFALGYLAALRDIEKFGGLR